jgi:hypothetical protein
MTGGRGKDKQTGENEMGAKASRHGDIRILAEKPEDYRDYRET